MGLLDSVISTFRDGPPASGPERVSLLPVVIEFVNEYPGGLAGLLQKLQQGGLGDEVASWLANGQNKPVSSEQIKAVLGDAAIGQMAQSSGQEPDAVLANLTALLPMLVDHVTPMGQFERGRKLDVTSLMGSVSGLIKKL